MNEIDELIAHLETQKTTRVVDSLIAEIKRLQNEVKQLQSNWKMQQDKAEKDEAELEAQLAVYQAKNDLE